MSKFTLLLSGLPNIILQYSTGRLFAPAQQGFTEDSGANVRGLPIVAAAPVQSLDLEFDVALSDADFTVFDQYVYAQEQGGQKGNIVLRNEWYRVNADWAAVNNRSTVGSPVSVGGISKSYVQYPVLLILPSDWYEPSGRNSLGQWWDVRFVAKELTA